MGPGMMVKAAMGRRFSLITFGIAQVATDIEPLVHILRGDRAVHGFCHTYVGAAVVGSLVFTIDRPARSMILRSWRGAGAPAWARGQDTLTWGAAASGAFIGTFSHVFLDSLMHADTRPFAPFTAANPLLHLVSVGAIYLFCVATGALGAVGWWLRHRGQRTNSP